MPSQSDSRGLALEGAMALYNLKHFELVTTLTFDLRAAAADMSTCHRRQWQGRSRKNPCTVMRVAACAALCQNTYDLDIGAACSYGNTTWTLRR
jgi:hypothetical protein